MSPYTYLFVRKDLSIAQQMVQASHAALDAGKAFEGNGGTNLVLIGVTDLHELREVARYLEITQVDHVMFFEPDIDQHTAIATSPLTTNRERRLLRKYRLYG
jgi:hypothetical protein